MQKEAENSSDASEDHNQFYAAKDLKNLKIKTNKRGQEEDVFSAVKSLLNSKLLPHTSESQPFVNCFPSLSRSLNVPPSLSVESLRN